LSQNGYGVLELSARYARASFYSSDLDIKLFKNFPKYFQKLDEKKTSVRSRRQLESSVRRECDEQVPNQKIVYLIFFVCDTGAKVESKSIP